MSDIKIAMLGMVDGNGHPYSWSAMFNGYNPEYMKDCPFPVIPVYLGKQPKDTFGIPGARVTHIWTDDPKDAEHVAKASLIPNILEKAEDAIGKVDAVIVATDKGWEHVERCRPFVEAGIPMFVDKPLADNIDDLRVFCKWVKEGKRILSSSSMRYTKEMGIYHKGHNYELGDMRLIVQPMTKTWERYGIHALEHVYLVTGPGYISATNTGSKGRDIVHLKHSSGCDVLIASIYDIGSTAVELYGTAGGVRVVSGDSYYSFKTQLEVFVEYLKTDVRPYPFSETEELMKLVIAGIMSREQGGREVMLSELEV